VRGRRASSRLSAGTAVLDQGVDLTTRVGAIELSSPILTASGTAGHGAELAPYVDLASLGAVVVKSLSAEPWPGNPAPRVTETPAGMINSVGLQGPGVDAWIRDELPELLATGARVVASIWGTSVDAYRRAAEPLADLPDAVLAIEVNLSCPNVEAREGMFAHSVEATTEAIAAVAAAAPARPRWAKLSPNVTDLVAIARAAQEAGADAVTLINTVMGLVIDVETRRAALGNGGGGLSGRAIHPVAVRAVWDVHAACPDLPIVGVGGVASGVDAVEMLLAGASAVQVGTATFADPRAVGRIQDELQHWCRRHDVRRITELIGGAHE
jgi:dihydroorotate dehydrogenase (NAD+) catalytic subunit